MLPALYGDCFLVRCHDKEKTNVLIDTGFKNTYSKFLKNRLLELSKAGETLSLLVFTHIDQDHLLGGIELLKENGHSDNPNIIKIEQIWHNSYRHIQFDKTGEIQLNDRQQEILSAIIARGLPVDPTSVNVEHTISARQGTSLAALILKNGYSWNQNFGGNAIFSDNPIKTKINNEVILTLLSPNKNKLSKLSKFWADEIYKIGFIDKPTSNNNSIIDDAFEFLLLHEGMVESDEIEELISHSCKGFTKILQSGKFNNNFVEDKSPTNGSSISFILNIGNKRLLFLGDSHPLLIEENLAKLNPSKTSLYFDAIKIAHHGSQKNTSPSLLKLIDSENYLISTNGNSHSHPDVETLARIVSRQSAKKRKLIFNYPTSVSSLINDTESMEKYNYVVKISDGNKIITLEL